MRIDYSISLWNFTHYCDAPSLERVLTLVREQGYGIELWGTWRDETDLYSEVGRRRLKSALQGMHVSLHTAGANTSDLHKKQGSLGVAVILDISGHAPCDFAAK